MKERLSGKHHVVSFWFLVIRLVSFSAEIAAAGWTTRVRFLTEARDFYFLHSVQTDTVAQPTSYLMDIGSSFPGGKMTGA
jgi:hypothetical protein